jgi:hypothetical protein
VRAFLPSDSRGFFAIGLVHHTSKYNIIVTRPTENLVCELSLDGLCVEPHLGMYCCSVGW